MPEPSATPKSSGAPARTDGGLLTIWVPEDAKVFVNGFQTKSTGNRRQYVSYGLKPGFTYKYEIRAVVLRNGQTIQEVHRTTLTAGARTAVAFSFDTKAATGLASVW